MKLARFEKDGSTYTGIVRGDRVLSVDEVGMADSTVVDLLALDEGRRAELVSQVDGRLREGGGSALDEVVLLAPIERPPKYLAMGFNSSQSSKDIENPDDLPEVMRERLNLVAALKAAFPNHGVPTMFNKQTSSVTGPFSEVWAPYDAVELDYEGELVVVIARAGRRLSVTEALDVIGGYTVGNDVSIREWQFDTPTMWMGKSFDTHGPIGPWVVTPDEIDPDDCAVRTWVNDEIRQDGSTSDRKLKVAEVVSAASRCCSLEPGDLIATGTGGGLAQFTGRYMKAGDEVRVEIEGIGMIANRIVPEPGTPPVAA